MAACLVDDDGNYELFDAWLGELGKNLPAAGETHESEEIGYKAALVTSVEDRQAREGCSPFWQDRCSLRSGDRSCLCTDMTEALVLLRKLDARGQVWWPKGCAKKTFNKPGALDLFIGHGGVAKNLLQMGCPFVVTYEWQRSPQEDLLWEENQHIPSS